MPFIKNIGHSEVFQLSALIDYLPNQIVSKTLSQYNQHNLTLFAFDKGEEISTHTSEGDAMIIALDGTGEITIENNKFTVNTGETIIMSAQKPHAVFAVEKFKMLLLVMFS